MMRVAAASILAISVSGCGMVNDFLRGKDNAEPPAPLLIFQNTIQVQAVWSARVGSGSADEYFQLTPHVVNGKAFAADRKGRVSAYDAANGRALWSVETKVPISGGPGSGDGVVLVGTSDGEVLALEEASGVLRWRERVSSEVLSAPVAAHDVVVVRTVDGKLQGLDLLTGKRLWTHDSTVPALTLRSTSAPVIVDDKVLGGFASGRLVALSISDGRVLWETVIAEPRGRSELERLVDISSEPRVIDQTVYVSSYQGRIAALDVVSGRLIWTRDMSSYAGLSVDDRAVYITDDKGQVFSLDRRDGRALWKQDKLRARAVTAPAIYKDYVVVGDFQGYLHWMARDDGGFVARVRVDEAGIITPPTTVADMLYVNGKGGVLAALKAGTR